MNLRHFLLAPCLSLLACTASPQIGPGDSPPPPADDSTKYELGDMQASLSAQSDGTKITVYAALIKGGAFLDLGAGDALAATVGDVTKALARIADGTSVHYTADFDQAPGAIPATIAFTRAGGRKGATSQVLIPAPFAITSPPSAVSRTADLAIRTSGIGTSTAKVELRGVCIDKGLFTGYASVDLAGTVHLSLATLTLADANAPSCPIEMTVEAYTEGQVDPSFQTSVLTATEFEGVQRRVFQSSLVP
jgi:hypothetical protein